MLGWWIVITEGQIDGKLAANDVALASWEVGLGGLRWLDDLVAVGKAQKLRDDGYAWRALR